MKCQSGQFKTQKKEYCFRRKTKKKKQQLPMPETSKKKEKSDDKQERSPRETISGEEQLGSSFQMPSKQDIEQCIGVLQSKWTNPNDETIAVCFGTAFAIAEDTILTCAHNVFSQVNRMVCDSIKFIPGKAKSSDFRKEETFTSTCRFIAFEKLGFFERYSQKPLPKDFAVILLNRQLPFDNFLSLTTRELIQDQSIEIIGYPRRQKQRSGFKRVDLQGEVIQTRAHIIVHNMPTQSGHSGSPILCRTKINNKWKYEVCGLHSHKGPLDYNRGVAITPEIKLKIDEMVSTLRARQSNS